MDWNLIKLYLTLLEEKNISATAKKLDMSDSTLFRRLTNYEKEYGKLFIRKNGEYIASELGGALIGPARDAHRAFGDIERALAFQDSGGASRVRITAPTSFSYGYLPALIEKFKEERPDINVDLLVSNDALCLNTRQADIAVRVTSSPPDNFIGKKVRDIKWGVYGGYSYLSKYGTPTKLSELNEHKLIGGSGILSRGKAFTWLQRLYSANITINTDDLVAMFYLAQNNHGLALLPDEFDQGNIKRLFTVEEVGINSLWVLTHSDFRGVERVRAVARYLAGNLSKF